MDTVDNFGVLQFILTMKFLLLLAMIRISHYGGRINYFGPHRYKIIIRNNQFFYEVLFQVAFECVSLSFHPFGIVLAAGSTEGHLLIINTENGVLSSTIRICGSPLSCIAFNPSKIYFIKRFF